MTITVAPTALASPYGLPAASAVLVAALEWWRGVRNARALRRAMERLEETSPHLLFDAGIVDHPPAPQRDGTAARSGAVVQPRFAGRG